MDFFFDINKLQASTNAEDVRSLNSIFEPNWSTFVSQQS